MKKLAKVFGIFILTISTYAVISAIITEDTESRRFLMLMLMVCWLVFRDIYKHYYHEKSD